MKLSKFILVILAMISFMACSSDGLQYLNRNPIQTGECVLSITDITIETPIAEKVPEVTKASKITIKQSVMFEFDKAIVRENQMGTINTIVNLMKQYPDTTLVINGYASKEGPKDYNQKLSQRRADAIRNLLLERGIPTDRIKDSIGNGAVTIFGELLKKNRKAVVLSVE